MSLRSVLGELRSHGDPAAAAGMARFGISSKKTLGVSVPTLRKMAGKIGRDHALALGLWDSGIHEARILASMVDDPRQVTERQMDRWVMQFDSWDVCDQACGNLFDRTGLAYVKATEWARRNEEFVRRAGYVMMAELAVHDKKAPDSAFMGFLGLIEEGAADDRNFVKKAVNWSLRQIGKRNSALNKKAMAVALKISRQDSGAARWVASDALRELRSPAVQARLRCSSEA